MSEKIDPEKDVSYISDVPQKRKDRRIRTTQISDTSIDHNSYT